jgi:DNA replicative helicase MCM subunit Mcm2 (Cdc46/Mcm family)
LGKWAVEAGALVYANNNTFYMDEIDKLPVTVTNNLLEAMEQQSVSLAKAGINVSIPTRTRIFACANPKPAAKPDAPPITRIPLSTPILSRFDLILFAAPLSEASEERSHELTIKRPPLATLEEQAFLTQYVSYARNLKIEISKEIGQMALKLYKKLKRTQIPSQVIGSRQLEGIYRLLEAKCKASLRKKVSAEDYYFVQRLVLNTHRNQQGKLTFTQKTEIGDITSGIKNAAKKDRAIYEAIFTQISIDGTKRGLKQRCFKRLFEDTGGSKLNSISHCIEVLENEGQIYSPTEDTYQIVDKQEKLKILPDRTEPQN